MNDTTSAARAVFRTCAARLTPETRVRMACAMFSDARTLAGAGAAARGQPWNREQMLRRFYGGDLAPEVLEVIASHLRTSDDRGGATAPVESGLAADRVRVTERS